MRFCLINMFGESFTFVNSPIFQILGDNTDHAGEDEVQGRDMKDLVSCCRM